MDECTRDNGLTRAEAEVFLEAGLIVAVSLQIVNRAEVRLAALVGLGPSPTIKGQIFSDCLSCSEPVTAQFLSPDHTLCDQTAQESGG